MSQIIVGIDGSTRAEDALIFASRLADVTGATLALVAAFPYQDWPSPASDELHEHLSEDAGQVLRRMRDMLDGNTLPPRRCARDERRSPSSCSASRHRAPPRGGAAAGPAADRRVVGGGRAVATGGDRSHPREVHSQGT